MGTVTRLTTRHWLVFLFLWEPLLEGLWWAFPRRFHTPPRGRGLTGWQADVWAWLVYGHHYGTRGLAVPTDEPSEWQVAWEQAHGAVDEYIM